MTKSFLSVFAFLFSLAIFAQSSFTVSVGPEAKNTNMWYSQVKFAGEDDQNFYVVKDEINEKCFLTINVFDKKTDALKSTVELDGFKSLIKPAYFNNYITTVKVMSNTFWVVVHQREMRKNKSREYVVVYDKTTGKPLNEPIELMDFFRLEVTPNNEVCITRIDKTAKGSKTTRITYDENAKQVNQLELENCSGSLYNDGSFYNVTISSKQNELTVSRFNASSKEVTERKITSLLNKTISPSYQIKGDYIYITTLYKQGIDEKNKLSQFDGFAVLKLNKTTLEPVYESAEPFDHVAKMLTLGEKYKETEQIGGLLNQAVLIKDNGHIVLSTEVIWNQQYGEYTTRGNLILMEFGEKGERVWSQCIAKSHMTKYHNENTPQISLSGNNVMVTFLERADNQIKNLKEYYSPKTMNQYTVTQNTDIAPFVHTIGENGEMTRNMALVKSDKSYNLSPFGFQFDERANYYLIDGKKFKLVNITYTK
jgi:hypothetical protein